MDTFVDTTFKKYQRKSMLIILGLTLITVLLMTILQHTAWIAGLIVTILFSFTISFTYGLTWKKVAKSSDVSLTKYYLIAPVLRILVAFLVFLSFCLIVRSREIIIPFMVIFLTFYVALLIFDSIFFAKVEKIKNQL